MASTHRLGLSFRTVDGIMKMELRAAVEEFLRFCTVERHFLRYTLRAYRGDLADFSRALPAGVLLSDISNSSLKEYLTAMASERRLATGTIRRRFACLRVFFGGSSVAHRRPTRLPGGNFCCRAESGFLERSVARKYHR